MFHVSRQTIEYDGFVIARMLATTEKGDGPLSVDSVMLGRHS